MDRLNPNDFASLIVYLCDKYEFISDYELNIDDNIIVKSRIFLIDASFIEIYYNFENGKTSFSLIRNNKRIFGVDNLGFWHIHPFDNPKKHIKSKEIKLEDFLGKIKNYLSKLKYYKYKN